MTTNTSVAKRETVIEHVLARLKAIGISKVFGVAGDYAFSVDDAVMNSTDLEWVGCCNELNANVEMKDILAELTRRITKHTGSPPVKPASLGPVGGRRREPITAEMLYPRWANFLKPNDLLITETGTSAMGLAFALLPRGATFHNQALWGSIGWATPAAFGAAVAAPTRRVVLVTGDGSH